MRTRLCFYLILLTPLLVYCQTVFHEYGMRDDYANLREAREQPGKLVRFTASHGRPLYGALLETSLLKLDGVESLAWLRLSSVILLTLLALALWRQLYQSGWTEVEAMVIGLGITLLPAAQVVAGWATAWPHVLALLLAVAGFAAVESELERGGLKRIVALAGGVMIYAIAAFIYQSNAVFAIVPIAAVLLVRPGREPYPDLRWSLIHLATLAVGLLLSYGVVQWLFTQGIFQESGRLQFETNPLTKLGWFFGQPLPNALATFALRDDYNVGAPLFWASALIVVALLAYSFRVDTQRAAEPPKPLEPEVGVNYDTKPGAAAPLSKNKWLVCLVAMPLAAHVVSLCALERSTGYRVLFALSGLVVVLIVYSLRSLRASGKIPSAIYYGGLGGLLVWGAFMARQQSFALIAQPQGHEWGMIRSAALRLDLRKANRVYIITPQVDDRTTTIVHRDEFGSLSTDSDWVPREMFMAAVRERFPEKLPKGGSYTVTLGRAEPPKQDYDLILDLRKLRNLREP